MTNMYEDHVKELLEKVRTSEISVEDAVTELQKAAFQDLGYAKVDFQRQFRNGHPEVIFCQGKTPAHIKGISEALLNRGHNLMATRADPAAFSAIAAIAPDAVYHESARIVTVKRQIVKFAPGTVAVVSAGTSDIPVAEEAAITAEMMGSHAERIYDVGVAGIHRLFANAPLIMKSNVIIVVAGMEGALASVVGGLVDKPVIAVPTSIGYGANFGGLSALLAMLNSCVSGIGVVNIDNGFGAGFLASRINRGMGAGTASAASQDSAKHPEEDS